MKIKKSILLFKILLFIILFIGCGKMFRFLLVDDTSSFTRIMMHEFYHQDQNIDILFVGSSHCYFSFVPAITDEIFDKNTFCAGSSAQQMGASYEIIKEADRLNNLEHIYLEVYHGLADYSPNKERTLMTSTYIVSDYMRPSLSKIHFLLKASSKEYYVNSFIPARRNWADFLDPDYVMTLIQKKTSDGYQSYSYDSVSTDTEQYMGKGYVTNNGYAPEYFFLSYYPLYPLGFSKDWENSLNKIIDFCAEKEIALTLVSAPLPTYTLEARGNYDVYIEKINQIIEGTDVDYYDFNLCKEDYIPNSTQIFRDSDHLNTDGATLFSNIFARFFTDEISKQDLFYNSYEEKSFHLDAAVFGLNYQDRPVENSSENLIRHVTVVSNRPDEMEYRILLNPEDSAPCLIQDFSKNREFELSPEEHGECTLSTRLVCDPENTLQTIIIAY